MSGPDDIPEGMVEFTVSVPLRPDLAERTLWAPDEATAWAKYRDLCGEHNLSFPPKIERVKK